MTSSETELLIDEAIANNNKAIDRALWCDLKDPLITMLRPVWVALGETREVEDIIFRLYPPVITRKVAFDVLRELNQLVSVDCPDNTEARDALQSTRHMLMNCLR